VKFSSRICSSLAVCTVSPFYGGLWNTSEGWEAESSGGKQHTDLRVDSGNDNIMDLLGKCSLCNINVCIKAVS
jgi:hypothetical protein